MTQCKTSQMHLNYEELELMIVYEVFSIIEHFYV